MLLDEKMITGDQLDRALSEQKKMGLRLGQYLVQQNIVKEAEIIDILSRQLRIDRYRPDLYPVDPGLAAVIPLEVAQRHKIAPLKKKLNLLTIAMVDPLDITAIDTVETMTNMEAEPVVCSDRELNQLISLTYGKQSGLVEALERIESVQTERDREDEPQAVSDVQLTSLQDMAGEAPIIRLVNSIIAQAVREGVSDIHISPEAKTVQLRFRIDGKLHEVPAPPKSMVLPIISRIKILANMDISVTRVPQDGRFTVKMDNREINIRASVLPTIHGENAVLRLLDMSSKVYTLEELGMAKKDQTRIEGIIQKPFGMILSTGPTGSGKTTSLYAILQKINRPDINIITLEDPVEYRIDKIRQAQLNRRAGMTFASGLRSILRQDPDVIMVGEIRDSETAGIAIQAALTGHRVLSTVHTNDAAGAITRLLDMGIEPFLVSSVLLVSFAQRLVRTVCPYCRESYQPPPEALAAWSLEKVEHPNFQRGKGCPQCLNTGYRGRTGIFEILAMDDEIQEMILRSHSAQEISRYARNAGKLRTLKDDAAEKVLRGITTLEEAIATVMY